MGDLFSSNSSSQALTNQQVGGGPTGSGANVSSGAGSGGVRTATAGSSGITVGGSSLNAGAKNNTFSTSINISSSDPAVTNAAIEANSSLAENAIAEFQHTSEYAITANGAIVQANAAAAIGNANSLATDSLNTLEHIASLSVPQSTGAQAELTAAGATPFSNGGLTTSQLSLYIGIAAGILGIGWYLKHK